MGKKHKPAAGSHGLHAAGKCPSDPITSPVPATLRTARPACRPRAERLASDSEAVVKAEGSHSCETIEELQRETIEIVTVRGEPGRPAYLLSMPYMCACSSRAACLQVGG